MLPTPLALLLALVTLLPLTLAQAAIGWSTIYWPVLTPSSTQPWVVGQKNLLAWRVAGGTGIPVFDIQLHNWNKKIMPGYIKLATQYPMQSLPGTYKNLGGEIEIDLDGSVPTGDGFVIAFTNMTHGNVYATSPPFSILAQAPSNYSDNPEKLPSATVTATLTHGANPTQQWAITLDGQGPAYPQTTTTPEPA